MAHNPQCMHHLSCQVNIYFYIDLYFCLVIIILYVYMYYYLFLARNLCKNMYILNRLETNSGESMITVHAIWGLCCFFFRCVLFDLPFFAGCFCKVAGRASTSMILSEDKMMSFCRFLRTKNCFKFGESPLQSTQHHFE